MFIYNRKDSYLTHNKYKTNYKTNKGTQTDILYHHYMKYANGFVNTTLIKRFLYSVRIILM